MGARVTLLGRFSVALDGVVVPAEAWNRRHPTALVKLLALAPGRRLHREQVVEALWPGVPPDEAAPRLHKAAHYARRALGSGGSVQLRADMVHLLPEHEVEVDVEMFLRLGRAALAAGDVTAAATAADLHTGPLLPEDPYEEWASATREEVRTVHLDLLRCAGRWADLLAEEPVDEQAHLALAREHASRGDQHAALRQLERMDRLLRGELGTAPSAEAVRLREQLLAGIPAPRTAGPAPADRGRLFGRRPVGDAVRGTLEAARSGHGTTLLVSGPAGIGKSAVLDLAVKRARDLGWRVGRGTASTMEGAWPYACVLEALADLCRQDPALLDGLEPLYRAEIERALSGRPAEWTGESTHQCLFVATAELARLAAADRGLLLVVDDVHEADQGSLRLLHYLARCIIDMPAVLVLAQRDDASADLTAMTTSLVARGIGTRVDLRPLDRAATARMLGHTHPGLDAAQVDRIWLVSAGVPFTALELARQATAGDRLDTRVATPLPEAARRTVQRLALLGTEFDTDEVVACAGADADAGYAHLDAAIAARVIEPVETGYRFRHALVREAVLESTSPHDRRRLSREVAVGLQALDASPARIAHHLLAAGDPAAAVPYATAAAETSAALGAYRDALDLVDAVLDHAHGDDVAHLLARRGDLLTALGDQRAVAAYRAALPLTSGTEQRLVRARLARACCFTGDFATASAALEGLEPEGDAADGPLLLARGNLAYFTGDVDTAWEAASEARRILLTPEDPWHYVDLVALQGLIAHDRGEWFERLRLELRQTREDAELATALFDAHLCVAEYLLYGPVPYAEVLDLAESLRDRARRSGALRGVAFATALIGEASLLMGDLPQAERELTEAVELHRDVAAPAGEAHSLQRLAELRLLQGQHDEAKQLLQRALPLARWSVIAMHLLQRIYGTMIRAEDDPARAHAVADRAAATMGSEDTCPFCGVMLAVPAAVACAQAGDVEAAHDWLGQAVESAGRWAGSAWDAGVLEARAWICAAEGDRTAAADLLREASRAFSGAGQPLDAQRCTLGVDRVLQATTVG
jgi:DNA-binding SARP family transcriptional activator/tetratricopeptide (TPR) repeat protein